MSDPFESAEFTLRRAKRHFQDFESLVAEYMASDAYTLRTEFNRRTGLEEVKLKFIRDFPEDLRGSASDAVKNIRDALDQAMAAASAVVAGKRSKQTHFPFGESEDDLENSLSRRKAATCKAIPEELFPAIRYIKPYPHAGDQFRLKLLQKVSGPHKHSVALTLGTAAPFPFAEVAFIDDKRNAAATINFPEWHPAEGEVVVATHSGGGKLDLSHAFHIAFDHPDLRHIAAGQLLAGWGTRTEWAINGLKKSAHMIIAERGG